MKYILTLAILMSCSSLFAQNLPQHKVYDLDALDKVKTTNTAIYNGTTFIVYASKNGRLYFETGKLTKTGAPQRKYLRPAVKKI